MGETNSPSVAHVGYDKKINLTFWVEKYRNPRATIAYSKISNIPYNLIFTTKFTISWF
jgi:hypothetical protein